MDEREIRRAIHARYKAKSVRVRELERECARLEGEVRVLREHLGVQREIVSLAEQALGLADGPGGRGGPVQPPGSSAQPPVTGGATLPGAQGETVLCPPLPAARHPPARQA